IKYISLFQQFVNAHLACVTNFVHPLLSVSQLVKQQCLLCVYTTIFHFSGMHETKCTNSCGATFLPFLKHKTLLRLLNKHEHMSWGSNGQPYKEKNRSLNSKCSSDILSELKQVVVKTKCLTAQTQNDTFVFMTL
uniref:Uncharacterized protein n=1 Tax=Monopterus albus TaxID=43700 RepID=A0A3Q3K7A8_MONAL